MPENKIIPAVILSDPSNKAFRKNWARLIQKVYEIDPLVCPKCKGRMRIIAFIEQPILIRKVLEHLDLWDTRNHDPPPAVRSNIKHVYDDAYSQIQPYDYGIQ